ncbi:PqqD family protein [Streptomyces sp. NPDC101175]|uniref:PqqD family protein n=1 Tax=Streptomyces sp. NPDC101175 TaxID=3366123 RepID=UPI0038396796
MPRTETRLRLPEFLHLQPQSDGSAHVVDDRTFSVARVNASARVLLESLREPRTEGDLRTALARAADCTPEETAEAVTSLIADLGARGWIETDSTAPA